MVSMPMAADAAHKVRIEVMPLFAGHLPFPKIKVLKYLPHTAAVAIQPDPGKLPNARERTRNRPSQRIAATSHTSRGILRKLPDIELLLVRPSRIGVNGENNWISDCR